MFSAQIGLDEKCWHSFNFKEIYNWLWLYVDHSLCQVAGAYYAYWLYTCFRAHLLYALCTGGSSKAVGISYRPHCSL